MFDFLSAATMDFFSIYLVFLFGFFLTGTYGQKPLFGGLVSLAAFLALGPVAAGSFDFFGTKGVLMGLVVGMTAPMLLCKLSESEGLKVSMPAGVPKAVADSFNSLFPITITLLVFAAIQPI